MSTLMATDRIRLVVVVDEEIRDVLRLEKAITGEDISDIVARVVREQCAESLAEVRRRRQKDKKKGG